MLSDKEIKSNVEDCQWIMNECLSQISNRFIDFFCCEQVNRKDFISVLLKFQRDYVCIGGSVLSVIYERAYKKGYEDALLNASNLNAVVNNALRKRKKKH